VQPSENPSEKKAYKTVKMVCELFDYDFVTLRSYLEKEVPAQWWNLTLTQLLELLDIEVER